MINSLVSAGKEMVFTCQRQMCVSEIGQLRSSGREINTVATRKWYFVSCEATQEGMRLNSSGLIILVAAGPETCHLFCVNGFVMLLKL